MGLFNNKRKSGEYATDTHHPTRDGVITGAIAHHESNQHPDRNALLAGGAVGELQHHRNKKEEQHAAAAATAPMATHHTHGMNNGYGTGAGAGAGVAATGAPLGANGNTGPAPLHGVHANGNGAATSGKIPAAAPAVRQANSLERKAKSESFFGDLFCSRSLKSKAHTHAAQADHLKMQASELSEAERLENEAGMRRQRAVGLGAAPEHATGTTGFAS